MKRVALGMSGGVDSSVAAVLLKEQGYEVIPVFMRNWDSTVNNESIGISIDEDDMCPQERDFLDAKKVCDKLGLPLHKVNFVEEYWDNVFKYFLDELEKGRTPNPDMMCNKFIKFSAFRKACAELDVDYFAFGHYAIYEDEMLKRAFDKNKDQTYFLALVEKENFKDFMFPLGNMPKSEVREIALKYDLATATKKDSTGICFIGNRDFPVFLQNYFSPKKGEVINIATDEKIGEHNGLVNYTIGQRRGLNIGGYSSILYVVGKDVSNNILYVADEDNKQYLISTKCSVVDFNWLCDKSTESFECYAKFRYRQELHKVYVTVDNNNLIVEYEQGIESVTPGQACVLYIDEQCIGGGIIDTVYDSDNNKMVYIGE